MPLHPSRDMYAIIISSMFGLVVVWLKHGLYACVHMCYNQVSQGRLQGAFSSQHAFPLAGCYFRQGSQFRKGLGLIGTPPPTVPACVSFSVAPL